MASVCDFLVVSAEWLVRETHNLEVVDRVRDLAEIIIIGGFFRLFLIAILRAAFCVLACVCEAQLRLCV